MTETAHTVRGYAGLVSVAVQSLGFIPEESLVMVCLTDSAHLGPIGRIDLPEHASDEASFAAAVGDLVAAADQHADAVVLMLFTRAPARRAEFAERLADHAAGTFWFVLPSLPMFLLMPAMLTRGYGFWPALVAGCLLTIALYLAMIWIGPRFGLRL